MEVGKTDGFAAELDGEPSLLIHHRMLYNHPPLGPTPRCRILITGEDGQPHEYAVHILFREVERGRFPTTSEFLDSILKKYSPFSATYIFCPRIAEATYREYYEAVHLIQKAFVKWILLFFELIPICVRCGLS